jgi:FlaA1/EpsC-like NDP-sugar epimerase
MEVNPTEAISNNVLVRATRSMLRGGRVERFVLISTDKSVRPKSVMSAQTRG